MINSHHEDEECVGTICVEEDRAEYRNSNMVVFVTLYDLTSGTESQYKEAAANSNNGILETIMIGSDKLYRLRNDLLWFTGRDNPTVVITQEGTLNPDSEGYFYVYGMATGDNPVTKKFLSMYPSQEVD